MTSCDDCKDLCDLAAEVSCLLNDSYDHDPAYNFTRWSKDTLVEYARDAVRNIFMLYPAKFTNCVKIELKEGEVQKLPENCTLLTKVIGVNNGKDATSSIAFNTDDRLARLFPDVCSGSVVGDYKVENYSIEETSDNIFYVNPPVPKSKEPIFLEVICSELPADLCRADYCPEPWMLNLIILWMQYRAYLSEDESTNSVQNANTHLEHFYAMLRSYIQAQNDLMTQSEVVRRQQ